jgi:hypothetical protein
MGIVDRVRKILWAEGYSYFSPLLGLIMFVLFAILPWIMCDPGAITLIEHYVEFGKTFGWVDLMIRLGQPDAALAFSVALILVPLAFFGAFTNKPIISGLLFITSGLLLIYMYNVTEPTGTLWSLVVTIWAGPYGPGSPENLGPYAYAIVLLGILFLFGHYYSKRREPKEAAATQRIV